MSESVSGAVGAGDSERLRRWRLVIGEAAGDGGLGGNDLHSDGTLRALYGGGDEERAERRGGLGSSAPNVARWLGDIRTYFPASVVRVMQQDALERLGLRQMLLQPELLEAVVPD